MIRPRPFDDRRSAAAWLERIVADAELSASLASEAARNLNRALHAHRTAAGDPHLADVDPSRALAVRFGYGTGDEVAATVGDYLTMLQAEIRGERYSKSEHRRGLLPLLLPRQVSFPHRDRARRVRRGRA